MSDLTAERLEELAARNAVKVLRDMRSPGWIQIADLIERQAVTISLSIKECRELIASHTDDEDDSYMYIGHAGRILAILTASQGESHEG